MSQVFAVKIVLQDKASPVAENTAIGLYNVAGGNSEFRWIQNSISGVTDWKDGMIVEKGLKPFSIGIDLRRVGSASLPGRGSVVVKNNEKLWQTVQALGLSFVGLRAEIYLFQGTSPLRLRTYACDEPTWDGRDYTIPFKGQQESRIAQMLNTVTSIQFPNASKDTLGKKVPLTIGKNFPLSDVNGAMTRSTMAKFVRVQDKVDEDVYANSHFEYYGDGADIKYFPVTSIVDETTYRLGFYGTPNFLADFSVTKMYVVVRDGTGEGQIRKVTSIGFVSTVDGWMLYITIDPVFVTELSATDDDTRSWVQLIKVDRDYAADHIVCKDFLASDSGDPAVTAEMYAYSDSDKKLNRVSEFGFTVKDDAKNQVSIAAGHYTNDVDTLKSFVILPVTSLELENATNLDGYNYPALEGKIKHQDGFYIRDPSPSSDDLVITNGTIVNPENAYDGNSTTYAEFSPTYATASLGNYDIYKTLKFGMPKLPRNVSISKIYLGLKSYSQCSKSYANIEAPTSVVALFRRFIYSKSTDRLFTDQDTVPGEQTEGLVIDDLPDFYYSDSPDTKSVNFYKTATPGAVDHLLAGYTLFDTGLDKYSYGTILNGALVFGRWVDEITAGISDTTRIYDLAIILELSDETIKDELFIPLAGRTFAATWDGRKTPSDLIEKPADILESFCRFQSWHDRCDVPVSGWGLQYAGDALVATSGYGSFDAITGRDLYAAGQLTEEEEGYTDKAKQTVCRNFGIANWQDKDGYERAIALPTTAQAPIFTVTLESVMDRQKVRVSEPMAEDIFAEPFVRYEKNPATGEYERLMAVKNASAGAYSASYVDGVQNAGEAQDLWQTCHSLYLKTHQVTKPPTDLTDLTWANGTGGYSIALSHLQRWVRWQSNSEIEFPLHVTDCLSWAECTPINLLFSHQTDNLVRAALVEEIEVDPNTPYEAMIKAILYA